MKATTLLTAFVLAAFLYDEGYRYIPLALVILACWEGFLADWFAASGRRFNARFSRFTARLKLNEMQGKQPTRATIDTLGVLLLLPVIFLVIAGVLAVLEYGFGLK